MKGYTLIEALIAVIIVSIIMTITVSYLVMVQRQTTIIDQHQQQLQKAVLAKHILGPAIANAGYKGCLLKLKHQPGPLWQVKGSSTTIQELTVSHLWPLHFSRATQRHLDVKQLHPKIHQGDQLVLTDCHKQHWLIVAHVSRDFHDHQQILTFKNELPTKHVSKLYLWQTIQFSVKSSRVNTTKALFRQVNQHQSQEVLPGLAAIKAQCLTKSQQWQACTKGFKLTDLQAIHLKLTLQVNQQLDSVSERHIQLTRQLHGYAQNIAS